MRVRAKFIKNGIGFIAHILAWIIAVYIFNQVFRTEFRKFIHEGGAVTEITETHTFLSFIIIVVAFKAVFFYLNAFYLMNALFPGNFSFRSRKNWRHVLFILSAVVILIAIEWVTILLADQLWQISRPPAGLFIWPEILIWLIVCILSFTWAKMREWDKREELAKKMAEERLKTELNFLKAQISPHFFLNTLNNLYSMAQANDTVQLGDGILQLSGMMRYMLYDCQADTVPVQREIECIRSYIGLTLLRYRQDGNIQVTFNTQEKSLAGLTIAPVILLPFVENAFKHGIISDKHSLIEIELYSENFRLVYMVRNTDHADRQQQFEKKGIGFNNVTKRLDMLYPGKHELTIEKENGFYTVWLKLTGNEMRNSG